MTWQEITFDHPENVARGRNDWFMPRWAHIFTLADSLRIEICSCRAGYTAPVVLQLNRSDAHALAGTINDVLAGRGRS